MLYVKSTKMWLVVVVTFMVVFCFNTPIYAEKNKFVLLSEPRQKVARESAMLGLKDGNGNTTQQILIESILLKANLTEHELCNQIFNNTTTSSSSIPTFVLDISTRSKLGKYLARKMGIPSLHTGSNYDNSGWRNLNEIEKNFLISVMTPESVILHMVKDIVLQLSYRSVVLIYDHTFREAYNDQLIKNVRLHTVYWTASADELPLNQAFQEVNWNSFDLHVFVVGTITTLNQVLAKASGNYLFGSYENWYFISKEKGKLKCDKCINSRLAVSQPLRSRLHIYEHEPSSQLITNDTNIIVDVYYYYDLARFYANTVNSLIDTETSVRELTYPKCGKYLNDGQMKQRTFVPLYEKLSKEVHHGMFGQFMFNYKSNLNYQELSMRINKVHFKDGIIKQITKMAEWEFEGHLGHLYFTSPQEKSERTGIAHYNIVTLIEAPFVMEVGDNTTRGNDRFYGYCIDLLKEIVNQSEFKFEYTLRVVDDNQYGFKDENGEWTGLIGELVRKKADIALGPISVMAEREIVVDFTVPYYDLVGITILMKKPTVPSHLFKFLTVLETNVWLCILAAYFFTSFLMYLFDRLSPYSFHNNREKYKDDDEKREFTLKECLWFCMTSLTPQGGGEAPRNLSGRLVAATWWLFGFIIIASYTANLAAFLTVSRLDSPIESLDDLSKQYKIKYAPQAGTSTATYFERMAGIEEKFYEIWKDMSLNDSLSEDERAKLAVWDYPVSDKYTKIWSQILEAKMPISWSEGLRRVKNDENNEQFAFISESTMIKYAVMTNCDLQNIGNEFSRKPLALAVQQNSDLKDKLSSAILKLLNQRRLENLKEKWWNRNPEKKDCQDSKKQSDGISINNIGGVFIVIFIGIVLACITLVVEYWYFKGKESKVDTTITDQMPKQTQLNLESGFKQQPSSLIFNRNLADQRLILRQMQENKSLFSS